jgi:hypothetical protein
VVATLQQPLKTPSKKALRAARSQVINTIRANWIERELRSSMFRWSLTPEFSPLHEPRERIRRGQELNKYRAEVGGSLPLLGTNGAGKSTLLAIAASQLADDARSRVSGRTPTRTSGARRSASEERPDREATANRRWRTRRSGITGSNYRMPWSRAFGAARVRRRIPPTAGSSLVGTCGWLPQSRAGSVVRL